METKFRVSGGLRNSSFGGDLSGLGGLFLEEFEDQSLAVARARELAALLKPGGSVLVREFKPGASSAEQLPDSFVGLTRRKPDGTYWSKAGGIDFKPVETTE